MIEIDADRDHQRAIFEYLCCKNRSLPTKEDFGTSTILAFIISNRFNTHHHHLSEKNSTVVVFQGSRINSALLEPFFFFQILDYVVIQAEPTTKYMHSFLFLWTVPIAFFACGAFLAPNLFSFP